MTLENVTKHPYIKGDSEKVNFLHDNIADNLTFQEYCKKVMNRHSISCLISQAQYGARKDQMNTSKGQTFWYSAVNEEQFVNFHFWKSDQPYFSMKYHAVDFLAAN